MESKLKASQREAEEVKDIMLDNLNKAEERKEKLEDLDLRGAELLRKSQKFKKKAKEAKQKSRNDYLRSKAGLIAVVTVLALVIIIILAAMFSSTSSSDTTVQRAAVTSKPNITEQS